ncbi:MAG: LAGLIDADG family homing endonuclease [Candidatus Omnitrophota bacterium]
MPRVKFLKTRQSNFLKKIKKRYGLDWPDLAEICRVDKRTFFDWRRDKYQMSYTSFQALQKKLKISTPKIKVLQDDWNVKSAGRLGALRRMELYGNIGTPEGRSRGGLTTRMKYRMNPQLFKETGFIGPKDISYPPKSEALSEAVGIILGDGSLTRYQLKISLNNKVEKEYSKFILKLFKRLFNLEGDLMVREKNTRDVVFSSVKLTEHLTKLGLKIGNKIRHQVSIPDWILEDTSRMAACLRGLVDTDGGVYYHNHVTKGIRYRHIGLCFTNHSFPLLKNAHSIFLHFGFPASIRQDGHVFVYNSLAIKKYFERIGTHNKHHRIRFDNYFKSGEVPKWS